MNNCIWPIYFSSLSPYALFIVLRISYFTKNDYNYCAQIKSQSGARLSLYQYANQINKRIKLTTSGVEAPSVCEVLSALLRLSESEVSLWLTSSKHTKKISEGHVFQKNIT